MSLNVTKFVWTEPRAQAAALVAADDLSDDAIADAVGTTKRTLERWKLYPEFRARVQEHVAIAEVQALEHGIARRPKRVEVLNDIWQRGRRLIEARAQEHADVPGGDTGLLVRQVKLSARGDEVEEYAVDTGLLKELREHAKQAAQELGQWVDKNALTDSKGQDVNLAAIVLAARQPAEERE
jgi:hypothetical protein